MDVPEAEQGRGSQLQEYVRNGQRHWREAGRGRVESPLQSVPLPFGTEMVFESMRSHLPPYLRDIGGLRVFDLPVPDIYSGPMIDKRSYMDANQEGDLKHGTISKEDEPSYFTGLDELNELANCQLVHDCCDAILSDPTIPKRVKFLVNLARKRSKPHGEFPTGREAARYIRDRMVNKADVERIYRQLTRYSFTHDLKDLEELLQITAAHSLDELALKLGRSIHAKKSPKKDSDKHEITGLRRLMHSMSLGGFVSKSYPGVIWLQFPSLLPIFPLVQSELFIPLHNTSLNTMAAAGSLAIALYCAIDLPYIAMHEVGHYLTTDINRVGLLPTQPYTPS